MNVEIYKNRVNGGLFYYTGKSNAVKEDIRKNNDLISSCWGFNIGFNSIPSYKTFKGFKLGESVEHKATDEDRVRDLSIKIIDYIWYDYLGNKEGNGDYDFHLQDTMEDIIKEHFKKEV